MDPALYLAARKGHVEVLRNNKDQLHLQLTPRNNTVLHVAAQFHNGECIKEILNLQPSVLYRVNSKGETALHIAARGGCSINIVRELVAFAAPEKEDLEGKVPITKELLWTTTLEEKNTALHEAVRSNSLEVVKLLVEEDQELSHVPNRYGKTPLYLAAERDYHEIVSIILETCTDPAHGGPCGRTALHAAVIADCSDCVEKLLVKKPGLIKEADSLGRTPLHCAARFDRVKQARKILEMGKFTAYLIACSDDKMTALHLAAKSGSVGTMQELLSHCPDCWEMVNERGQNILHIAIENENKPMVRSILKLPAASNLLNEKDEDGNTPLHLLAIHKLLIPELIHCPAADKDALNNKFQAPFDIILFSDEEGEDMWDFRAELSSAIDPQGCRSKETAESYGILMKYAVRKSREDSAKRIAAIVPKRMESTTLVATLVATVTFAASFTVPGGYESEDGPDQGMAVLVRKTAFRAFAISNTIAVTFSISSLILLLLPSFYKGQRCSSMHRAFRQFLVALVSLIIALVAMLVSFVTASFAVLATSPGFAITLCVICCFAFPIFFYAVPRTLEYRWGHCKTILKKRG